MSEDIIAVLLGNTGLWAIITYLITRHFANKDAKNQQDNVNQAALLALLHYRIYRLCKYHLNNGYITEDELEALGILYSHYRALGGNGTGQTLYAKICELPIK